jgi:phosphohistidine phosphatase
MATLLLMRHGKSDWGASHQGDHERPLNGRGVRSARIIGRLLAARGEVPDHVISSTAVRARTSAELAKEAGGWECQISLDADLYHSGPDGVIEVAAQAPEVGRLMLVGHQPTWSLLSQELTGTWVDMKTATVAVIEFDIAGWAGLGHARGALSDVINPREHFGSELDT